MHRRVILFVLMCACSFSLFADVVQPGEIKKQFMISNLDQYPGFTYYYVHHGYHYNLGWTADPADTALVENNIPYTVSIKGDSRSFLLGLSMTGSNNSYFVSDLELGGSAMVDPNIKGIVEVYTISGRDNGMIKLKKIKEILKYGNGREEERKSGIGWLGFSGNDNFTGVLSTIALSALMILLLLFVLKRSKQKYWQPVTG